MAHEIQIVPFAPDALDAVLDLTMRAWAPVFPLMQQDIPGYVYDAFYPQGWAARQRMDVAALCQDGGTEIWLARRTDALAGFMGLREHAEDSMGEVHILAVDPAFQRQGVARTLLDFAFERFKAHGLTMAMVETGDDLGHAPSRRTYENAGFDRYPVARYFRKL